MRRGAIWAFGLAISPPFLGCGPKVPLGDGPAWSGPVRESALVQQGSESAPTSGPLFETDSPLIFTLEADFKKLRDDRSQESVERPGRVYLRGEEGEVSFPVQVRTRGRFRLNRHNCSFPPIRLNFPADSLRGSVLDGLDKVKLVTHCQDKDSYEQNVLEEYLAYRIYGLLTEVGFRVQLALITYRDVSEAQDQWSRLAFFIESEDELAERLGGQMVEAERANPGDFRSRRLNGGGRSAVDSDRGRAV